MNGQKKYMIYTYSRLSCLKTEILTHATVSMNLEDTMLRERNQSPKDKYFTITLTLGIKISPICKGTGSGTVVARGGGKWEVSVQQVHSFSWGRWKSAGDGWWWWLHHSVGELNATDLYTEKWLKWLNINNSVLCIFYHNFLKKEDRRVKQVLYRQHTVAGKPARQRSSHYSPQIEHNCSFRFFFYLLGPEKLGQ